MPYAAPHPCAYAGCPKLVRGDSRCAEHRQLDSRTFDALRCTSAQRGYGSRWQKARRLYLQKHPLCVLCGLKGRLNAATVVDHKLPHKGNQELFWDESNWQALCKPCHDRKTAQEDGRWG